ncbi:SNF2-related protein [Nostoc sp. NMS9]|uniref:SNF2-related protein n=1 Tax=Nostoc sp. NMS9 TaxID=2815393 RepID=UPI0025FCA76B|nr:SNF2-related protein [Nostoc sp. NMS9]MBN3944650.1 hypothetical protein [Nostoc sp. NMS9]
MAKKSKGNESEPQSNLDNENTNMKWPPNALFPLNLPSEKRNVKQEVIKDINSSENYLINTGFSSLGNIIDIFNTEVDMSTINSVRILLGSEPDNRPRKFWKIVDLQKEIKDYWLERRYSLLKGGNIIKTIEYIRTGKLHFKILDNFHAKLYIGESHAISGSSNFSKNGLSQQLEANVRVYKNSIILFEKQQYEGMDQIAENYYKLGQDYKDEIIGLLEKLMSITSWEEALARAIAEILECNWFKEFPQLYEKLNNISLWPAQRYGLGQALYILQTQGCVLIADPTGSGKTKLISTLQLLLFYWLWESDRMNKSYILTICPPIVQNNWHQESVDIGFAQSSQVSMGLLSHSHNSRHKNILKEIQIANILTIDEAHNYLNSKSQRSDNISKHKADYVILSTATPISKQVRDLLRLIEMLDVDNLDNDELNQLKRLKKGGLLKNAKETENLRKYIKKFILRRTKKQFKNLIEQEPEKYKDKFGRLCRYPKTESHTYATKETTKDKSIALEINNLAKQLKGIIYLQKLEKTDYYFEIGEEAYIKMRLNTANTLAIFAVQATLRSSRVALIELIEGTKVVLDEFKFTTSKTHSGNIIEKLETYKIKLPDNKLSDDLLPSWLTNLAEYQKLCDEEIKIYTQIAQLVRKISPARENSKVNKLVKLFENHNLVIAFDSTIITLDYLKKLITENHTNIETYIVTGTTTKDTALKKFELGSKEKNILGLLSDCMSEGVNLQQASAVLFLDMPTVLRIAEQRIGRIDRLDSPHKKIQVFWPSDSDEFALRTDKKLIKTSLDAESLIGLNFDIPPQILDKHMDQIVRPKDFVEALEELEQEDYIWEGIQDAFKPVHDLYEGENSLIQKKDYLYFKDVNASIKVKISILESKESWLFIATRGGKLSPPRWYFIDSKDCIYSELPEICRELRAKLNTSIKPEMWTDTTTKVLSRCLQLLKNNEIKLLPNKRRRALEVVQFIIERQLQITKNASKKSLYEEVLELFKPTSIDSEYSINYYLFSQQWLDILNPYLFDKRQDRKYKRQIVSLNDLKEDKEFHNILLNTENLEQIINNIPYTQPIWQNVAACIISISSK